MSRENLGGIYKGGGQNMWISKALEEFVTVKFQQSKQNNGITEKKNAKPKDPLLNFASEEKLPRKIAKNCQLPAK